jgi:peptide/nickel transport system ATP-binding protein
MYLGKIVEMGDVLEIYNRPLHPYTQALLASVPSMDPANKQVETPLIGDPPSPMNPPSGCRFRTRCRFAMDICSQQEPLLQPAEDGWLVACHLYGDAASQSNKRNDEQV